MGKEWTKINNDFSLLKPCFIAGFLVLNKVIQGL